MVDFKRDTSDSRGRKALAFLGAVLLAWGLCTGLYSVFEHKADVSAYVLGVDHLVKLADGADAALDSLIEHDAVTWDPTETLQIERVLARLKRTDEPKLLMVGSSQLLVPSDDWLRERIWQRVDRALVRVAHRPLEVYNLSKQGMTDEEKAIVVEAASREMDFDYVVVSLSLWDCRREGVNRPIAALRGRGVGGPSEKRAQHGWLSPAALNARVSQWVHSALEGRIPFLFRRSAIQRWLRDLAMGKAKWASPQAAPMVVEAAESGEDAQEEEPQELMQCAFDSEEDRERVWRIVDRLFGFLKTYQQATGTEVTVLLPPFMEDAQQPLFVPESFYREFLEVVSSRCEESGVRLLDASRLLDRSHFGPVPWGPEGTVDRVHFDTGGHERLAEWLVQELDL